MIVSWTVCDRPGYLRESLESWRKVAGTEDARFLFNCEPVNAESVAICEEWDGCASEVIVNPRQYGVLANPWYAFERGFAYGDFVVLAEEDVIVSSDVLTYMDRCRRTYESDPSVLGVCAFTPGDGDAHGLMRGRLNNPPPLGIWRDRWQGELRDTWQHDYAHKGWDHYINDVLLRDRYFISPGQSRAQHIGREGGVHCLPEMFDGLLSPSFHESYPGGTFAESVPERPATV